MQIIVADIRKDLAKNTQVEQQRLHRFSCVCFVFSFFSSIKDCKLFTAFNHIMFQLVFVFSCFIFYFYLSDFSLGAGNHEIDQDINCRYK